MKIRIKELQMRYGVKEVLSIPELVFEEGKSYGVVGHNGAGKTTLFKCITNIIATYEGQVLIDDNDVREHNKVLLNVGIVLDGMSVYQDHTGWFNINYFSGLRGETNKDRARQLAKELDLIDALDDKVSRYSYGMQKKLILLIALLHNPNILILDEPFRGLDSKTVSWFKEYLKKITKKGQTLLISSHVQNDLEALCDEVVVISQGKIAKSIDLIEERKRQFRIIDSSDNEKLKETMREASFPFQVNSKGIIRVDIENPGWNELFSSLPEHGIILTEMTKVKILEDKLN